MKTSNTFNRRIASLVDTYRGSVPLARCILEATRLSADPEMPSLLVYRDPFGDTFLEVTFPDSSTITLAVTEEM